MRRYRLAGCFALAGLVVAAGAAHADEKIRVLNPTPVAPHADVPTRVKDECKDFGRTLPLALARANRDIVLVGTQKELTAKSGRYLVVEIVDVTAAGGGVWSGPKRMRVRVVAFADGKQVGDAEGERGSTMSFSACGSLEKVEKALGQDIARWAEHPRPHDKLKD